MMAGTKGELRISGAVELVEHLGNQTFVEAKSRNGTTFNALLDGETLVKHDQHLAVSFKANDCHLFTAEGEALTRLMAPKIAGYKRG
jgi:multiple sugar transport system ATP-binding protein